MTTSPAAATAAQINDETRGSRRGFLLAGACAFVGFAAAPAAAIDVAAARRFVEETAREVLALIRDGGGPVQQQVVMTRLLRTRSAVRDVARVAIGRVWNTMSEAQRSRYVEALTTIVARQTVAGFQEYAGETIRVVGAVDNGRSGVFVQTVIEGGSQRPVQVDWRIIDRNGPLQLFDVYVDGVSLLTTQRQTFAERLERVGGDVEAFIAQLEAEAG